MRKKLLLLLGCLIMMILVVGSPMMYVLSQSEDDTENDETSKERYVTEALTPTLSGEPVEDGITAEQFRKFIPGITTKEEVKMEVGEPEENLGEYIPHGDMYLTADDHVITIYYTDEVIREVRFLYYPKKEDITLEQFEEFVPGVSTEDEVKSVVGEPHDYYGYGFIRDVYLTADGHKVVVYYIDGVLDEINIWY